MKRIGYIYKYSEKEKKGILVYGRWIKDSIWLNDDLPLLFSDSDCISKVKEGQLVYFELNENKDKLGNIERASLANFDKNVILEMTTQKEGDSPSWYEKNTHIYFEDIDSVVQVIPHKKKSNHSLTDGRTRRRRRTRIDFDKESENNLDILDLESQDFRIEGTFELDWNLKSTDSIDSIFDYYYDLPTNSTEDTKKEQDDDAISSKTIDDIWECCEEFNHQPYSLYLSKFHSLIYKRKTIPILELSYWIDKQVLKNRFFGETFEELEFLYDIFVMKRRIDDKGNLYIPKEKHKAISNSWKMLLSRLSDNVLVSVADFIPMLQPKLPTRFCKAHIDLLNESFRMPSISICKLYYLNEVQNACSIYEYKQLYDQLSWHSKYNTYFGGDETPISQMGEKYAGHLKDLLEIRFNDVIRTNFIKDFYLLIGNKKKACVICKYKKDNLILIYNFIKRYINNSENSETKEHRFHDLLRGMISNLKTNNILEDYTALPKAIQDLLYRHVRDTINKSILVYLKGKAIPHTIYLITKNAISWIDYNTKIEILRAQSKFAEIDDISDLWDAYKYGYISLHEYEIQIKNLTKNYDIYQLLQMVDSIPHYSYDSNLINDSMPSSIQWYFLHRIIEFFDFKSLNSYKSVLISNYESIYDIRSLLNWLKFKTIDEKIRGRVEQNLLKVLNNEERWKLFVEELVSSPGEEIIRERLNKEYKDGLFPLTDDIFKKECFQLQMYKDLQTSQNSLPKYTIIDNLNEKYQRQLYIQSNGVVKLYLWLKHPYNDFNWELIKSYFSELPEKEQFILFRFVFFLIATNQISLTIDDIYEWLVESNSKACPSICCIVCILKSKFHNPDAPITNNTFVFCKPLLRGCLSNSLFDFFYSCNGFLALTHHQLEREYQKYYGILNKVQKSKKWYYQITFYNKPQDFYGHPSDLFYKEEIDIAKSILEINFEPQINGEKYLLPLSDEKRIKCFIMAYHIDDRCHLLIDYTNYLTQYENSNFRICRCSNYCETDPVNRLPYYWCNKKICVRHSHYILSSLQWAGYKFADFLYILMGMKRSVIPKIWEITSEISNFFNNNLALFELRFFDFEKPIKELELVESKKISEEEEVGVWNEKMSTKKNISIYYDESDEEYEHT